MISKKKYSLLSAFVISSSAIGLVEVIFPSQSLGAIAVWSGAKNVDWNTDSNWGISTFAVSTTSQSAIFTTNPAGNVNVSSIPTNAHWGIFIGNGSGAATANEAANITFFNVTGYALTLAGSLEMDVVAAISAARSVFQAKGCSGTGAAQDIVLLADSAFTIGRDISVASANPSTGTISIGNTVANTSSSTNSGAVSVGKNVQNISKNNNRQSTLFRGS